MANYGQHTAGTGPYDPSKGERTNYFKAVQADLNKQAKERKSEKKTKT